MRVKRSLYIYYNRFLKRISIFFFINLFIKRATQKSFETFCGLSPYGTMCAVKNTNQNSNTQLWISAKEK